MSDERNDAGQFTEANLVGERYEQAKAGFIPAVEPEFERGPEDAGKIADLLSDARGGPDEPDEVLGLTDPDDTEPKQAISQRQLTDTIGEERRAHEGMVERVGNAEIAAFADALRADIGLNPGIAPEPSVPPTTAETAPSAEVQAMIDTGVERDTAEALAKPQIRAAVEAEFAKAGQVQEAYTNSLQTGQQMLQATVAALAPQLDGMPLELWPQAIQALAEVDPVRANLVADTLNKWGQFQQAQQQANQQQAYVAHQQFEATVKAEDARLTELFGGDKAAADAANEATINYLADHGVARDQMLGVFKSNPVLSTAEARRTIWEANQYRKIQSTKVTASAKPAPPVQRPGVSISAAERQSNNADARTSRARSKIDSGKGEISDVAALLGALRRA